MSEHGGDGLISVANVVFGEFINVLCVNRTNDGLNANLVDDVLEGVALPFQLLVVLELKDLTAGGGISDGRIDEGQDGFSGEPDEDGVCEDENGRVINGDVDAPLSSQDQVDSEGRKWAKEWQACLKVQPLQWPDHLDDAASLPGMTTDIVKKAALTFPQGTGLGWTRLGG